MLSLNNTQVKEALQLVFGFGQRRVEMQENSSKSDASPTADAISKVSMGYLPIEDYVTPEQSDNGGNSERERESAEQQLYAGWQRTSPS